MMQLLKKLYIILLGHERTGEIMAKPIKDTPILCGKDAERFTKKTKENETQKVSKTEYDRVFGNYNKIKKIAKF